MYQRQKLNDEYTTKQLLTLLRSRYGLNDFGIKRVLKIDTRRLNQLKKGDILNMFERVELYRTFEELRGRMEHDEEEF